MIRLAAASDGNRSSFRHPPLSGLGSELPYAIGGIAGDYARMFRMAHNALQLRNRPTRYAGPARNSVATTFLLLRQTPGGNVGLKIFDVAWAAVGELFDQNRELAGKGRYALRICGRSSELAHLDDMRCPLARPPPRCLARRRPHASSQVPTIRLRVLSLICSATSVLGFKACDLSERAFGRGE